MKESREMVKSTIDEIVEYVSVHGGPDLERRAHPTKKRVYYSDLCKALDGVDVPGLKAYHFKDVQHIWNENGFYNKELARELFDELIQRLTSKRGSLIEAIHNLSFQDFKNEILSFRTKDGAIEYTAGGMIDIMRFDDKHTLSPYAAVRYWIDTHPDERIRREYAGFRPWHMKNAPNCTWTGEEGKSNGRECVDQLMQRLMKRYNSFSEMLVNLKADEFEKEEFEFRTSDGAIRYDLSSMFAHVRFNDKHSCSHYAAIAYWVDTHPDDGLKRKYREEITRFKKVARYLERK